MPSGELQFQRTNTEQKSTIRTEMITNENQEILFRFRNGKANKLLRFSFAFAFVMVMLGMHKPQQQATLTKIKQIPEIFFGFRFRNSTERILNPGICIHFRL